jgi:hypothetical protein
MATYIPRDNISGKYRQLGAHKGPSPLDKLVRASYDTAVHAVFIHAAAKGQDKCAIRDALTRQVLSLSPCCWSSLCCLASVPLPSSPCLPRVSVN